MRRSDAKFRAVLATAAAVCACLLGTAAPASALTSALPSAQASAQASARHVPQADPSCSGSTDTWTGDDDTSWTNGDNWSDDSAPGPDDVAELPRNSVVELDTTTTACGLELQPKAALQIDAGDSLTTQAATLIGGPTLTEPTALAGQLDTTDLHVEGGVSTFAAADSATPITLTTATFELDAASRFVLDDSASDVEVTDTAVLGGRYVPAELDSSAASDADDSAKFLVDGTAQLDGDLNSDGLDVVTTPTSVIDTDHHTWKLTGDAFSEFAGGTQITSTIVGGILAFGNENHLIVSGSTSIGVGATLALEGTGTLSDGHWFSATGKAATITGGGHFEWANGTIVGTVTLAASMRTQVDGAGKRTVATPNFGSTTLTNAGKLTLTQGTITLADAGDVFTNIGEVSVTGGSFGAGTDLAPPIDNGFGAKWTIALTGGNKVTKVIAGSFRNEGTFIVADNSKLAVGAKFTQSSTGLVKMTAGANSSARVAAAALSLGGLAHLYSAPGYKPSTATVAGMFSAQTRSGQFAHVASTTNKPGTAWTLKYHGGTVDAVLH